ncbi:MAG: DUF4118 domain-containing protein [Jatrophihabitantaceae bacterium]
MHIDAWSHRDGAAVVAGLVAPLAVTVGMVPFRVGFPNTDGALVLVAVIVAVAANGHRLAGNLAAASAAVGFDFFLTRPYQQFSITRVSDIETTVLLLLVGTLVTELAVRGRRHRIVAVTDEQYLSALAATTELAGSSPSAVELSRHVQGQLITLLDLRGCRFERVRFGGLPRLDTAGRLRWNERDWDLEQYGMPTSEVELLTEANGRAYGRFVLDPIPGRSAPVAALRVASILANQVGAALAHDTRVVR